MSELSRRVVILLVGVLVGLETHSTVRQTPALRILDGLVLAIFVGEIVLKMAAHGRKLWVYL